MDLPCRPGRAFLLVSLVAALGLSACAGCDDGAALEVEFADVTCAELRNFSWVLDGQLAGMARPGTTHPLEQELAALHACDVALLVSLTPTPTSADEAGAAGLALLHLPVTDFTAPTQDQLGTFVDRARPTIAGGDAVAVHCAAGQGRTGTFLAVYLVAEGMTADEAIARVRELRPGSIETAAQEQAIEVFYKELQTGDPSGS